MAKSYKAGFTTAPNELEAVTLPTSGTIPAWLSGNLLRNGPGKFEIGTQPVQHWFDGLAMLSKFSFSDGKVQYSNKFLRTNLYQYAKQIETGTPEGEESHLSNTNVSLNRSGSRYFAMTEAPVFTQFDPLTLDTIAPFIPTGELFMGHTTAHPHYDVEKGVIINFIEEYGPENAYNIYGLKDGESNASLISRVPVEQMGYMHSFGMTENYIILAESALYLDIMKMAASRSSIENPASLSYLDFIGAYDWRPEDGSHFTVISRRDGAVKARLVAHAFFCFHHVNAYEEGDRVVVDLIASSDSSTNQDLAIANLLNDGSPLRQAQLRRYRLDLKNEYANYEVLSDESVELPTINYERNNTRPYRYTYGVSNYAALPGDFVNQLVKVDVQHRTTKIWHEADNYPGEPVFVASPNAKTEDDGILLSVVLDGHKALSYLLVLDAATFAEIGRAEVPQPVPFGFHGFYFQ